MVDPVISEYMSQLGKKGGSKGGKTRAANLSDEERSEIARAAAKARWAKKKAEETKPKKRVAKKPK